MAIIKQGPAFLRVAAPYKGWAPPLVREQRTSYFTRTAEGGQIRAWSVAQLGWRDNYL